MKKEPLEKEFEKPLDFFSKQEMAAESQLLDAALRGGSDNLRSRYLKSKGVVATDDQGKITGVVNGDLYLKYNKIFSAWQRANLSKLRTKKVV